MGCDAGEGLDHAARDADALVERPELLAVRGLDLEGVRAQIEGNVGAELGQMPGDPELFRVGADLLENPGGEAVVLAALRQEVLYVLDRRQDLHRSLGPDPGHPRDVVGRRIESAE